MFDPYIVLQIVLTSYIDGPYNVTYIWQNLLSVFTQKRDFKVILCLYDKIEFV